MARAKMTSKGQVTIPKSIRDRLGLKPGSRLEFYIDEHGRAVMVPTVKLSELVGLLRRPQGALSIEEMNEAIAQAAAARAMRGE
jgi:AbrB family looped-hinge helix DNA binding protein